MEDGLSDLFSDPKFGNTDLTGDDYPEDLFSILETFEEAYKEIVPFTPFQETFLSPRANDEPTPGLVSQGSTSSIVSPRGTNEAEADDGDDGDASQARKKLKFAASVAPTDAAQDGQHKMSHITVERNRRKQMNDHLSVLRTLMPCFYVKRGDQASIIGGVVDYIKELQQVLQSLEAKKQRKVYSDVLSPRPVCSPRPPPLSPRPSPLSPRVSLPVSPRTPQPGSPYKQPGSPYKPPSSPYKPRMQTAYLSPTISPYNEPSPSLESAGELAANSKSPVADVKVKFSGPNVLLKTVSHSIPGQALKIITALEGLSLEILHVSVRTIDGTMHNSFTIKIGIECELSADELAQEILQTFS